MIYERCLTGSRKSHRMCT